MNWIILALIAPLTFAIYQGLSKLLPGGISLLLVNAYAFLWGSFIMFLIHFFVSNSRSVYLTSKNLLIALSIGTLLSVGNFLIIKAYSLGAPQSSFAAILYPLIMVFSTLIGIFIWHEKLNMGQLAGILLAIVGIILVVYFRESSQLVK